MNEALFFGTHRTFGFGAPPFALGDVGAPAVTWVDWYNAASDGEQSKFDDDAAALDNPSTTPDQKANYISFFGGSDAEKEALKNYVATGGRATLFAAPAKNYGTNPIAVIKPSGPIEKSVEGVVLHPGTYTYSNVAKGDDVFEQWVLNNGKTVKRTVVQTSASVLPGGASYYTDNVLVVYQDTIWPSTLSGLPTWLPPGTDPIEYWGKVTPPAPPDWDILPSSKTVSRIAIVAAVAAVVVGGVLIVYYAPRPSPRLPEPAPA